MKKVVLALGCFIVVALFAFSTLSLTPRTPAFSPRDFSALTPTPRAPSPSARAPASSPHASFHHPHVLSSNDGPCSCSSKSVGSYKRKEAKEMIGIICTTVGGVIGWAVRIITIVVY
ncbi:hypothetical protein ACLB2K_026063 [Fragaria x ananassa]